MTTAIFSPIFLPQQAKQQPTSLTKKLTLDDLITYEQAHPDTRVELVNGQIVAMGGTNGKHNLIANGLWRKIDDHLSQFNTKCLCYTADIRVRITKYQYRYPDIVVDCSGRSVDLYAENPVLVGEVLSDGSTALFDKTAKLAEYQSVMSIQDVVLIWQTKKKVMVYHRQGLIFDEWQSTVYTAGDVVIESLGLTVTIDEIYKRVNFED